MRFVPLYREVPYQDPFAVYRKLYAGQSVLFESLKGPEHISRYSFIGIDPYLNFAAKNGQVEIECMGKRTISYRKPLHRLRELLAAYPQSDFPAHCSYARSLGSAAVRRAYGTEAAGKYQPHFVAAFFQCGSNWAAFFRAFGQ